MAPGGKRARRGGGAAAAPGGEGGEGAPAPAPGPGPPERAPRGDRADLPPELLEASRPALRAMPAGDPFWEELKRDTQEAVARRVPAPPAPWADLPPELFEKVARAVPAGDRLWFRLVCRSWAAAGAGAAPAGREEPLPPGKVTRTRGADAAASVTRAVMVLGALEGPPAGVKSKYGGKVSYSPQCFKNDLCLVAAFNGHLAVLQWARVHGCPWDESTCSRVAKNGHLAVLQWARAQGCRWDGTTCAYAAMNGHLEVLKWARAQGCPWEERTCEAAAVGGHLEVLRWARAHGCPE